MRVSSVRIFAVGGGGFIGTAFVAEATRRGANCTSIVRKQRDSIASQVIDLSVGSAEMATLLDAERPDVIVDLSGATTPGIDLITANVTPIRNLLAAINRVRGYDPRLVVAGSAAEYGDLGPAPIREDACERPVSEYGVAKLERTRLALAARRRGRRVVVARPFNVIGPGMPSHLAAARFVLGALDAVRGGSPELTTGDLSTVRDYLDVADVARAFWTLSTTDYPDEIVNVCSGEPVRTGDLLEEILRQLAISLEHRSDPSLIRRTGEIAVSLGDPSRLASISGERPRFDLRRSVRGLIDSLPPGPRTSMT